MFLEYELNTGLSEDLAGSPRPNSLSCSHRTLPPEAAAVVGSGCWWSRLSPRKRQPAQPSPPTCSAPLTPLASPPAQLYRTPASNHSSECQAGVREGLERLQTGLSLRQPR